MEAINCLTLFSLGGETFVATGSKRDGLPCLYIYTLDGREVVNKTVRDTNGIGLLHRSQDLYCSNTL